MDKEDLIKQRADIRQRGVPLLREIFHINSVSESVTLEETNSLMSWKLEPLAARASRVVGLDGEAAEVGVYKGGSAKLIASILKNKTVHLFDTFEGMPEDDDQPDGHEAGTFCDTSLSEVKRYLSGLDNCEFHKGFFPSTAKLLGETKFSFVHLDADIYQTTKAGIEFFFPRLTSGGIIFFDDYTSLECPGIKKAVDEYFSEKEEKDEACRVVTTGARWGRYNPWHSVCEIIKA